MEYTLEDNVIRVLRSPEVARVNFCLFGVDVSGAAYAEIAEKILEGHFTVEIDPTVVGGAAAQYSPTDGKGGKFRFRSNRYGFREWHAAVVHEATHALVDLRKIKISKIDDEVVAHVAHSIYFRRAGFSYKSHGFTNPTWFAARDVGDSIIRRGKADEALVKKLQEVVKNDPLYHDFIGEMAVANG